MCMLFNKHVIRYIGLAMAFIPDSYSVCAIYSLRLFVMGHGSGIFCPAFNSRAFMRANPHLIWSMQAKSTYIIHNDWLNNWRLKFVGGVPFVSILGTKAWWWDRSKSINLINVDPISTISLYRSNDCIMNPQCLGVFFDQSSTQFLRIWWMYHSQKYV